MAKSFENALVYVEGEGLKKVNELIEQGILCEFSVLASLEDSMQYAEYRNIGKVFAILQDGKIDVYEL